MPPNLGDEQPRCGSVGSDTKAPQTPLSTYAFFFRETHALMRSPKHATFEGVSDIVETMWQTLEESQKEKYR